MMAWHSAIGVVALCAIGGAVAAAQQATPTDAERQQLFEQLLADPGNVDLNLRYARVSAALGDNEGAIAALERLLVQDPDQPAVELQLGLLYFQLGSYDMARSYLAAVTQSSNAPPDLRAQAQDGLHLVRAAAAKHSFSGTLFVGGQAQTNPGGNPTAPLFTVSGKNQTFPTSFAAHSDQNLIVQASGAYVYDFGNVHGDRLEVDSVAAMSYYRQQRSLDLADVELEAGPRLGLDRVGDDDGTFKPYLLAEYVALGQEDYYRGYGFGLGYSHKLNDAGRQLRFDYEFEQQNYHASAFYPTARQLNGDYDHYAASWIEPIALGIDSRVAFSAIINRQNSRSGFFANTDGALAGEATVGYDAGPLSLGYPWVTSIGFVGHVIGYDQPDPSVNKKLVRNDWRTQYSLVQVVPVTARAALVGQIYRDVVYSNVRNFTYANTSILLGTQIDF